MHEPQLRTSASSLVQALQWTFAAAPGHPALQDLCDFIWQHVDKLFSSDEHLDVLERTGPGPWTDAVLKQARLHPHATVKCHNVECIPASCHSVQQTAACMSLCLWVTICIQKRVKSRSSAISKAVELWHIRKDTHGSHSSPLDIHMRDWRAASLCNTCDVLSTRRWSQRDSF